MVCRQVVLRWSAQFRTHCSVLYSRSWPQPFGKWSFMTCKLLSWKNISQQLRVSLQKGKHGSYGRFGDGHAWPHLLPLAQVHRLTFSAIQSHFKSLYCSTGLSKPLKFLYEFVKSFVSWHLQLTLEGITVNNVEVRRNATSDNPRSNPPKNLIITGMQTSTGKFNYRVRETKIGLSKFQAGKKVLWSWTAVWIFQVCVPSK